MPFTLLALIVPGTLLLLPPALTDNVVSQKGKVFSQTTMAVKVGDKITFRNDDAVAHNVYSATQGFLFNLRSQAPGTDAQIAFEHEGTAEVRCAFHPTMKLSVKVTR
jgi:plastocyanin